MYKYVSIFLLVTLSVVFTHCGKKNQVAAIRELEDAGSLNESGSNNPGGNGITNFCLEESNEGCSLMLQTISLDQKTTTKSAAPKVEINTVLDNSASMQLVMDKVINSLTNDNLKDVFKEAGAPEVKFDHFSIYRDYNQAKISSSSSLFPDNLKADYSDIYNLVRPLNKKNNGRKDTYGWQNWKNQNDLYISRLPKGSSSSDVDLFFNQLKNEMNQYLSIEDRTAQEDMGCALNLYAASSEEMIHGGDEYIKNLNNNPDNMKITIASQGEINGMNYRGNQCRKARTKNKLISPAIPCDETQPYIAPSGPIYQNNYSRGYHRFRSW